MQKLPYILVVGDKEKAAGAVAVRARGNQDLGVMSLDAFVQKIAEDIATSLSKADFQRLQALARAYRGGFAIYFVANF